MGSVLFAGPKKRSDRFLPSRSLPPASMGPITLHDGRAIYVHDTGGGIGYVEIKEDGQPDVQMHRTEGLWDLFNLFLHVDKIRKEYPYTADMPLHRCVMMEGEASRRTRHYWQS